MGGASKTGQVLPLLFACLVWLLLIYLFAPACPTLILRLRLVGAVLRSVHDRPGCSHLTHVRRLRDLSSLTTPGTGELRGRNSRTQQQLSIAVGSRLSAQQEEVGAISTAPKREKNNERSLRELVATASTLCAYFAAWISKEREAPSSKQRHPPSLCV